MYKSKFEWLIVINIKAIRGENKKTQRDIAECLNVSAGYIGQIESQNNRSMYSYDQLNELAKYFKCSPRDFIPKTVVEG